MRVDGSAMDTSLMNTTTTYLNTITKIKNLCFLTAISRKLSNIRSLHRTRTAASSSRKYGRHRSRLCCWIRPMKVQLECFACCQQEKLTEITKLTGAFLNTIVVHLKLCHS
ncbi:hypothetical protein RvY_10038-2 [Ramazzottius varieornatus]|uniref:Uncharacterized protein n=1 Tax=Ramazzottius varieornatus TaxID=947166 RepID=A0A1D1VDJ9_RAMVA|nr:hypothetical protein RvY_10038-2 [Ramazzottius varieornatus]